MLAIIQRDGGSHVSTEALLVVRIVLASIALLMLWTISPSLLLVKCGLTIAAGFAALVPLICIDKGLSLFRWTLPGVVYIGSLSYAIYAIHATIIALSGYLGAEWGAATKLAAFSIAVLALSYIMERIIQPMLSVTRRVYPVQP
jgi:peptidoglycan/LPS O-acetylase OafA/YrhL